MTSAIDIERRLRARYRQPAGVEQFGIEPVPEERKTAGWFDLFSIMFNFLINPGIMLSGGLMVAAGLSFKAAVAAGFFGTVVALLFYLIMATLGVDYGIPGQVATRAVYGLRGAKLIPSLLRTVVSIYWFAFQTLVGASAIVAVLAKITGVTYPLIKVSVMAYLFVLFARHDDPEFRACQRSILSRRQRLDLGFAGGLGERRDCRLAGQHHRRGGFRPLHALAHRNVGWHLRRERVRSVAVHRARRVRRGRNAGQGHQSFRVDRPNRNQLDRFPPCAGISLRRRLDHQRAQSLFGRTVAFKHVRTAGAVLDHADRERVRSGAVWRAGCVELFSLRHLVRERVFARRRRACVRLPVRATHADRRRGALRPERPLPLLGWLQSDRGCLDGDRLSDLHLRDPDRVDPGVVDAADHGCRLPADRLDYAARQVRDLASRIARRPSRVVEGNSHSGCGLK